MVGGSFKIDFTSGVDVVLILASLLPPPLLNTFLNMMDLMGDGGDVGGIGVKILAVALMQV